MPAQLLGERNLHAYNLAHRLIPFLGIGLARPLGPLEEHHILHDLFMKGAVRFAYFNLRHHGLRRFAHFTNAVAEIAVVGV